MMASERRWKALDLGAEYPLLWLKSRLDGKRVAMELTDLNRMWSVNMSRAEIIQSASDQSCNIDPGEDDEQYEQFLKKVVSALDGGKRTTIGLEPGDEQDWIRLNVSAPLPGSLPTFQWTVDLRPLNEPDSTILESNLLTPLLLYTSHLHLQIQQLVEELGHKDRVISKITDKLETSGNDLTQVFPGVSNVRISRKTSQRLQLASHIRGLADFDEGAWRSQSGKISDDTDLSVDEINSIFADLPHPRLISAHRDIPDTWYRQRGRNAMNSEVHTDAETVSTIDAPREQGAWNGTRTLPIENSMQDDDFQRQSMPPRRSASPVHRAQDLQHRSDAKSNELEPSNSEDGDQTTEDEDDLEPPRHSQRSSRNGTASQLALESSQTLSNKSQTETTQAKTPTKRKLGTLGGRKAKTPTPELQSQAETVDGSEEAKNIASEGQRKPASKLGTFGGKAKIGSNSSASSVNHGAEERATEISPPKKKSKLGTFGSKTEADTPAVPNSGPERIESPAAKPKARIGAFGGKPKRKASPTLEDGDSVERPLTSPRTGKLGTFGGRKAEPAATSLAVEPEADERRTRAPDREEREVEQPRENSEERANRKRDKLKAEIEEQSKVPVKKKRKF